MDCRLTALTLGVADMQRSKRFYTSLGWQASSVSTEHLTLFQAGPLVIALYPREALAQDALLPASGVGFGGITLAQNVRSKEEVDCALACAAAAGGTILKPAQVTFWGGYSGYFADPDAHPWEVAWNPHWLLADNGQIQLPS